MDSKDKKVEKTEQSELKENKSEAIALEKDFWKYMKYFSILILITLFGYLLYPFFNVPVWKIGIIENFFTKEIKIVNTWFHLINPLSSKTLFNGWYEVLSFNWSIPEKSNNWIYDNIKVWTDYTKLPLAQAITKDWNNLSINMDVTFKLKSNNELLKNIYSKSKDKYLDIFIMPLISKAMGDVFGRKDFYSVVSSQESLSEDIKKAISKEFEGNGFELITYSFKKIAYSKELEKRVEEIFDSQKDKRLAEMKKETTEALLKVQKMDSDSKLSLLKELKNSWLNVDDFVKIKTVETFKDKWNWNFIPKTLETIFTDSKK